MHRELSLIRKTCVFNGSLIECRGLISIQLLQAAACRKLLGGDELALTSVYRDEVEDIDCGPFLLT